MWSEFKRTFGKITAKQLAEKELYETRIQLLETHSRREEADSIAIKADADIAKLNARVARLEIMLGHTQEEQVEEAVPNARKVHNFIAMAKSNH